MSLRLLSPEDPAWRDAFSRLAPERRDVFHGPDYAQLCQETLYEDHRVLCAQMESGAGPILYPFVLRELRSMTEAAEPGQHDMTGLYGRNGVITAEGVSRADLDRFHHELAGFARDNKVLCAFDRYQPVMANESLAAPETAIKDIGGFVVADLSGGEDHAEAQFRYSLAKAIRKAERNGVTTVIVEPGADRGHLDDFMAIYHDTLDRNRAKPFYYFSRRFFERAIDLLGGDAVYIYAVWEKRVVSCELALAHGAYSHSFLGGTWGDALNSCANQLLKRDLIRFLCRRGCRYFLLGGGVSPGDGIETYKRAFAETGLLPSRIGCHAFDPEGLGVLRGQCAENGGIPHAGRFQFYDPD